MKPDIYYCHKCNRSHEQGECGKREAKKVLPERASERTPHQPSPDVPAAESVEARSRTDSRERPAPTQSDIDALWLKAYQAKEEHKRKLKREQMQRYRARK